MTKLPPDQSAWVPIAEKVLKGWFDESDSSTRASLTIGLRSIAEPTCQEAIKHLWPEGVPNKLLP